MSSFEVKVRRITVTPHPDPETVALACGVVDGYQVVILKDQYQTNDLAVYIPEKALVPDEIITDMQLEGRLAGPLHNRVKAIRLRGQLSQGLIYCPDPLPEWWEEGVECGEFLDIWEWIPPIPLHMQGKMVRCLSDLIRSYDIEDIKKYPTVLQEEECVVMTEKVHGSMCEVGCEIGVDVDIIWVSSKGISERGLCLEEDGENIYWRAAYQLELIEKVSLLAHYLNEGVILFGEVLGVQDLMYGLKKGQLAYHAFDIYSAKRGFLCHRAFEEVCDRFEIPTVPVLYTGPFSQAILTEHTSGISSLANHLREGVVVRAEPKRFDPSVGRVILKSISPNYLLRKGETTELQ